MKLKHKFQRFLQKKLDILELKKELMQEKEKYVQLKRRIDIVANITLGYNHGKQHNAHNSTQTISYDILSKYFYENLYAFHSQYFQDRFVLGFFGEKKDGVCVEIGAGDGRYLSNSLFFEETLNWKCLLIEPHDILWKSLQQNRPNAILLHECISSKRQEIEFMSFEDAPYLSGITDTFHQAHLQRPDAGHESNKKIVQVTTFEDVFDRHNITQIDYLSLDTEGSELECLQGINFEKVNITLFGIEIDYEEQFDKINAFLTSHGYIFLHRLTSDCFFCKPQS